MTESDRLFRQVREAYAAGDREQIASVINARADDIRAHFSSWLLVPEEIRDNSVALELWARPLLAIAQAFESAGDDQLMAKLRGGADNPLDRWHETFSHAHKLIEKGMCERAEAILHTIISELDAARGTGVDALKPKVFGLLSKARFRSGDTSGALEYSLRALDECRRTGDEQGARIYEANIELLRENEGAPGPNRVEDVRAAIAHAQELSDQSAFEESNHVLQALLSDCDKKDARANFLGKVWGLMGLNAYRLSEWADADRWTQMALNACRVSGDIAGVQIYEANLAEVARKRGRPASGEGRA